MNLNSTISYPSFTIQKQLSFVDIYSHDSKNILMVVYHEDALIGINEAEIIVKEVKSLADLSQPLYGITLALRGSNASDEARQYFATDEFSQKETKAMAVIFNQLSQRLMVSFYLRFNKPKSPLKVFKSIDGAINWLSELGA